MKPGFEIDFSIWQTFQKRFVWKISILNIFSDLQNISTLFPFGFRRQGPLNDQIFNTSFSENLHELQWN